MLKYIKAFDGRFQSLEVFLRQPVINRVIVDAGEEIDWQAKVRDPFAEIRRKHLLPQGADSRGSFAAPQIDLFAERIFVIAGSCGASDNNKIILISTLQPCREAAHEKGRIIITITLFLR